MKSFPGIALIVLAIATLIGVGIVTGPAAQRSQAADHWDQVIPSATSTPSPQVEGVVNAISERLLADLTHTPVLQLASTSIEEVQLSVDGQWASALLVPSDPKTGETLPSEPGLAILRQSARGWQVYLPTDAGWLSVLQQAPADLFSDEHKSTWEEIYHSTLDQAPEEPFSGYLLPWAGGITRKLSQSINHDLYTPSGSAHYAFDFYTTGEMWDIYAAKSGTVWSWRDDVPTCLQFTCSDTQPFGNFIVLQDTTTEPFSYQLYLHLAQNSIPSQLKQIGVPVLQGQFIGVADNTGQSWGHHLHFQVHTNPSSYWGYSVDIIFADVSINGGRPRTPVEATDGEVGQTSYLSLNFVTDDPLPPIGGLLDPLEDGFQVLDGQLRLAAWALDHQSGVAQAQVEAYYNDQWQPVGPPFNGLQMTYDWDVCASQVPLGPLSLRLAVVDYANNATPENYSLRHGLNNTICQPPPPACTPAQDAVAVFSSPDFSGECQVFTSGNYPDLAADPNFELDRGASILVGEQVAVTLYSDKNYRGRRETFTAADAGFSDNLMRSGQIASLQVFERSTPPAAPELQQPGVDNQFSDETLLFYWLGGMNGSHYQAQILSGGVITRTAQLTEPFWNVNDLPPGDYQWQVQSVNSSGVTSAWSPPGSFSIATDQPTTTVYTATYSTLFDPLDPDWIWTGDWQLSTGENNFRSPPRAFVITPADPAQAVRGSLTSPEIYLPSDALALTFYYRYQGEPGNLWDQRRIQISADGGPFEDLLQLSDDPPGVWLRSPIIDLSAYQGKRVRVRFTLDSLDSFSNAPLSWEIDDFEIAPLPALVCPADPDPGELPAQAQLLAIGAQVNGVLCPAGDRDLYSLDITAPDTTLLFSITANQLASPLDSYLLLLASDGTSLLAASDDSIPYTLTDSRLGYTFTRPGRYYLMVKAWDHPQAGSPEHIYTLQVNRGLAGEFYSPLSGSRLETGTTTLQVLAQDNGEVVQAVSFWWHPADWSNVNWQQLGRDEDGRDGWQIEFDAQELVDQRGMAFYALIEDRTGRPHAAGVWNIALETDRTIFLPIVNH